MKPDTPMPGKTVYAITRDAAGNIVYRSKHDTESAAWNALVIRQRAKGQGHLRHSVEDEGGRKLNLPDLTPTSGIAGWRSRLAGRASSLAGEWEREEAYRVEQRRLAKLFYTQLRGNPITLAEVRDVSNKKLYGQFETEWQSGYGGARSKISLEVTDPDQAQLTRALRERHSQDTGLPLTAQVKEFQCELRQDQSGVVALVFDVERSDLWSFIRSEKFRRGPGMGTPRGSHDLTRRDVDILKSVQAFHKIKPGGGYEGEARLLAELGIIASPTGDLVRLNLTAEGTELLRLLSNAA